MSLTTTKDKHLTRGQTAQMPALLEFYSPSAALLETRVQGPARSVIWTVGTMFLACAAAAALIPIDKVVTASGKVAATENTIVVQPYETSIVREIDVSEGQSVKKGQLLAKLDPTFAGSDATASVMSVDSLRAEVERREAERAGVDYHPTGSGLAVQVQAAIFAQRKAEREFRIENYKQKIASLTGTLAKALGDIQAYGDRLQVAQTVEGKRRELAQLGWGSQLNQLAAQDTRLDLQRSLTEAQQTARSAANDLQAMKAEAAGDDQNWKSQNASDLTDAQRKLDAAQGDLSKNTLRSKLVEIRADQDATVLTVASVSVGSVMQSGDQLLLLVPQGAPLEVDATILGSDAGYVRPGDHVTLKFDTFSSVLYGTADGTVMSVSPDSFTGQQQPNTITHGVDPNAGAVLPDPGQAYYRTKISIDKVNLHDTPRGFRVVPGMPITADIMVGKRTVMSYLFSRVIPVAMDGMREP